jgi:acetolactate synthase-1/2/3 large subunit
VASGAERLVEAAVASGVELCFSNPGTTELPLVDAFDRVSGIRAVLGLFEGVCTGAADGYGRVAGKPALTLLHLGPGFANGIANLHNARRARTPVVNLIGDHATWHLDSDAPLTSDIVSLASPVSAWVHTCKTAGAMAGDLAAAVAAAVEPPGQVATLIVPADCQWDPAASEPPEAVTRPSPRRVKTSAVDAAARAIRSARTPVLYLGGEALGERGLRAAARIQAATRRPVFVETFPARLERGRHLPWFRSLPYFPERALEALSGIDVLVTAGARPPVSFFAVPGVPSALAPQGSAHLSLADPGADVETALDLLAESLGAVKEVELDDVPGPEAPSGAHLNADTVGLAVAALLPERSIVVDEGATSSLGYGARACFAAPHTALGLTGGAIGMGLPLAVGAAVAAPDRRVIALQADGSGMYTVQALWTMAREALDVTVVVFSNRRYAILGLELMRAGVEEPGPTAIDLTDLSRPDLDWVSLASGMGVPGTRATSADEFVDQMRRSLANPGPSLIEAVI